MHAVLAIYCETDIFWLLFSLTAAVYTICVILADEFVLFFIIHSTKGRFFMSHYKYTDFTTMTYLLKDVQIDER